MLPLNRVLAPNAQEVAGEVIDGEAVIINLATGVYYSLDRVGGSIWALIEAENGLEAIVTGVVDRYEVSREQAEADIQGVVAELLRERLVVVSEQEPADREAERSSSPERLPYDRPELKAYRDLGDLLALDPPVPGLTDIPSRAPETLD